MYNETLDDEILEALSKGDASVASLADEIGMRHQQAAVERALKRLESNRCVFRRVAPNGHITLSLREFAPKERRQVRDFLNRGAA